MTSDTNHFSELQNFGGDEDDEEEDEDVIEAGSSLGVEVTPGEVRMDSLDGEGLKTDEKQAEKAGRKLFHIFTRSRFLGGGSRQRSRSVPAVRVAAEVGDEYLNRQS